MTDVASVLLDHVPVDPPQGHLAPAPADEGVVQRGGGDGLAGQLPLLLQTDEVLLGPHRIHVVEGSVRPVLAPVRVFQPLAPEAAPEPQCLSTSVMCRTRPSSDMVDGGTERCASCSPVSPLHLYSRQLRLRSSRPASNAWSSPTCGSSTRVISGAIHGIALSSRPCHASALGKQVRPQPGASHDGAVDVIDLLPNLRMLRFTVGQAYFWRDPDSLTLVDTGLAGVGPDIAGADLGTNYDTPIWTGSADPPREPSPTARSNRRRAPRVEAEAGISTVRQHLVEAFGGVRGLRRHGRQFRVNCEGWVDSRAIVRVCAGARCP